MILFDPQSPHGKLEDNDREVILPRCRLEMVVLVVLGANLKITILLNVLWRFVLLSHLWRWSASQELSFKKWGGNVRSSSAGRLQIASSTTQKTLTHSSTTEHSKTSTKIHSIQRASYYTTTQTRSDHPYVRQRHHEPFLPFPERHYEARPHERP